MGKIHKKFKKTFRPGSARILSHAFKEFDQAHVIGEYAEKQYDAAKAAEAAANAPVVSEPVMPVADDEAIAKARRRALQRRNRGRSSTILGGGSGLGGGSETLG